jgi:hypothetical protein
MKTSLADVSRIFREYLREEKPAAGVSCPTHERLIQCVMGKLPRRERAKIISHAADCAMCAAALKQVLDLSAETDRAAAELENFSGPPKPGLPQNKESFWSQPLMRPAVAVLAGILLVTVLIVLIPRLLDRSSSRGVTEVRIALVSPVSTESTWDGLEFRWQSLAAADYYTIEVFDNSLNLVWRSGHVAGTELRPPAEVRRHLRPGETYFWMATAVTANQAETKSRLAEFSIIK